MFLSWNVVRFIFIKFCFALDVCSNKKFETDYTHYRYCSSKLSNYIRVLLIIIIFLTLTGVWYESFVLNFQTLEGRCRFDILKSSILYYFEQETTNQQPCLKVKNIKNILWKFSHVIIASAQCSCEKIHKFQNLFYLSLVWGKLSNFPFLLVLS